MAPSWSPGPGFTQGLCWALGQNQGPYLATCLVVTVQTSGGRPFEDFKGLGRIYFQNEFSLGELTLGTWGTVGDVPHPRKISEIWGEYFQLPPPPTLDRAQESLGMGSTQRNLRTLVQRLWAVPA